MKPVQADDAIPLALYDIAARHRIGLPLNRLRKKKPRKDYLSIGLCILIVFTLLCYSIYAYSAFISLSHTYPDIRKIPAAQLNTYFWLKALHDHLRENLRLLSISLLTTLIIPQVTSIIMASLGQPKIYLCTDGLLVISRKKEEAIRWEEARELYVTARGTIWIVREDGCSVTLSVGNLGGYVQAVRAVISEAMVQHLLPDVLASYQQGNVVTFGDVQVTKEGISRPGELVAWEDLGRIVDGGYLLTLYYRTPGRRDSQRNSRSRSLRGRVHLWRKKIVWRERKTLQGVREAYWPNLPVLVALVTTVLEQRSGQYGQQDLLTAHPPQSLQEAAALSAARGQRRFHIIRIPALICFVCLYVVILLFPLYQSILQQQQAYQDALQGSQMARHPYDAPVPGQGCDHGGAVWSGDSDATSYTCLRDGFYIQQEKPQIPTYEYVSFVPDDAQASGSHSFPAHYRVQVDVTFVGGPINALAAGAETNACASLVVHVQKYQGEQSLDICTDGSWTYYRCDLHCTHFTDVADGQLAAVKFSYLLAVDATSTKQTLSIDGQIIASIQDHTYSSTDQLGLSIYNDQDSAERAAAVFSDFRYIPYPS